MAAYTVMFQYLNAGFDQWVHDERTVSAENSRQALQDVARAIEIEQPGRKCVAKQIRKARQEFVVAAPIVKSITIGRFTIVQPKSDSAVCVYRNTGEPAEEAMEVDVAQFERALGVFFDELF